MLLYRSMFPKTLYARMVHTTSCVPGRRGPQGPQYDSGLETLVKQLKLPEEHLEDLNSEDVDDLYDQNAKTIDAALHTAPQDIQREKNFIRGKIVEQKFFKDLYRIKPGEVYNRNKDPFFKKGRDRKDFHHKHHDSIRKETIEAEKHSKLVGMDDILTQFKNQQSPLNPLSSITTVDTVQVARASTKYSNVQRYLSSPDEAYHSHHPTDLSTGKSVLLHDPPTPHQPEGDDEPAQAALAEDPSAEGTFFDYSGPCLMLWSMKEQMRYLHGTDPVYWSPDLLSTVFPINPANAKKILKSRWVPEDDKELASHDRRALQHWKELSGGKLRSHSLVTKAIENRLQSSNKPVSGLPVPSAVNDHMMDILDKLQFEHPEQARRQGVSPVELPSTEPPEHGYFADIVKSYKTKVAALNKQESDSDEATSVDLYSSELDVVASLPCPPTYKGRTVAVRGVAVSPEADTERRQRTSPSERPQDRRLVSDRQSSGDEARSPRSFHFAEKKQVQGNETGKQPLLDARPGLDRLKMMEKDDPLKLGVSRSSGGRRYGGGDDTASVSRSSGEPVGLGGYARSNGNQEDRNIGLHLGAQRGAGTDGRISSPRYIIEKGVREKKRSGHWRSKSSEAANLITYHQFLEQTGKGSSRDGGNETNKKQDGYFDQKDFDFLSRKRN